MVQRSGGYVKPPKPEGDGFEVLRVVKEGKDASVEPGYWSGLWRRARM